MTNDVSEVIRANMTPREIHELREVLGREVEIAPPKTNGDAWLEKDPASVAILDQIAEACALRDREMEAYLKAKPLAERAARTSTGHWDNVRAANHRALKLREALEALKAVPRA